jgi:hypothetical protein
MTFEMSALTTPALWREAKRRARQLVKLAVTAPKLPTRSFEKPSYHLARAVRDLASWRGEFATTSGQGRRQKQVNGAP